MFQILILVCSIGVAPADCQPRTALDVIHGPDAANELICGKHGQAYVAQTSLRPSADQYVKVQCVRTGTAAAR